ncbi:GNAT family N-acetyltransferase [Brevundimonas sp. 2R-24]|uniref:GNAT family N-acetyltransferase n=1 Tax=Peiella sedimenti TaxID=3061083 RepID=A0ABT8SNK1_9CAUL|nr:GNAT family N-acetyltransferase [Caulobacteraceae bacterium XZ-24]
MSPPPDSPVVLRRARPEDAELLARWDRQPHVIACVTDDPDAEVAFAGADWLEEITTSSEVSYYLIAEAAGRPIGAMQVIDPHLEPTHYWGEIEPNLRALDIWIGEPDALGRGYGTQMMTQALDACFAAPEVTAVIIDPLASNAEAHRFYQRLGFVPEERRLFNDEDDCLVHRLTREAWLGRDPDQGRAA